jgi:tetratricopeptide (TPR) repeat protein
MKFQSSNMVNLVSLIALLVIYSQHSFARSKYQREANKTTLEIHSNVSNATILMDGINSGIVGTAVEIEPGEATLTISAPGFVDREVVFNILENQNLVRTVNLGRISMDSKKRVTAKKRMARGSFSSWSTLPSACSTVSTSMTKSEATRPICGRKSLLEDLLFIGISGISLTPKLDPEGTAIYQDLLKAVLNGKVKELDARAELLFGFTADSMDGFHLVAWSHLLGDNCPRSLQVIETARAQGLSSSQLYMIQALCTESNGKPIAATKIMKAAAIFKPSSPEPFYHLSRLLLLDGGDMAKKSLSKCLADFTAYSPCYNLLSQIYSAKSETEKANTLRQSFKNSILTHMADLTKRFIELMKQNKKALAYAEMSQLAELLPDHYSINWMRIIAADKNLRHGLAKSTNQWRIYDRGSAEIVVNLLGEDEDLPLIVPAFETFVKEFPQALEYFSRLTNILYKTDQCQKVLPMINLAILNKKIQTSTGLLDVKGRCQIRIKDLEGAMNTFNAMVAMDPENWLIYYNLGTAQELAGLLTEAAASYRASLRRNPPDGYKMLMQPKIDLK